MLLFLARSDFSGVLLVISEKSEDVWNRRPALVGLRLRMAMSCCLAYALNRSMLSPSARVTIARLWSGREPQVPVRRLRLRLP